jgi:hypothetical protein
MLHHEYEQLSQDDAVVRQSMRDSAAKIGPLRSLVERADLMLAELRAA